MWIDFQSIILCEITHSLKAIFCTMPFILHCKKDQRRGTEIRLVVDIGWGVVVVITKKQEKTLKMIGMFYIFNI